MSGQTTAVTPAAAAVAEAAAVDHSRISNAARPIGDG